MAKSEIEALEVFWTAQREDEGVSEQELQRDFPAFKTSSKWFRRVILVSKTFVTGLDGLEPFWLK